MSDEPFYTVEEVANRLSVHPDTVRKWIKGGELRAINLGARAGYRISVSALNDFIKDHEERPSGNV